MSSFFWSPLYVHETLIFQWMMDEVDNSDVASECAMFLADYYEMEESVKAKSWIVNQLQLVTVLDNFKIIKLVKQVEEWKKENKFPLGVKYGSTAYELTLKRFMK